MNSNKLYNIPFWITCCTLVFGVFFFSKIQLPLWALIVLIGVCLIFLLFFRKYSNTTFISITSLLFIGLGGLRFQLSLPKNNKKHIIHIKNLDQPNQIVFTIAEVFKPSKNWQNYKVNVSSLNKQKALGSLLLKIKNTKNDGLNKGEAFIGRLQIHPFVEDKYPYGFNYNSYLTSRGITHQSFSEIGKLIRLPEYDNLIVKSLLKFQSHLNQSLLNLGLNSNVLQLTQALVLGNKKDLDKELKDNFSKAGVIHILAISGLHIGIIYMVFVWLFNQFLYLYKYRVIKSILVLACLWVFVWFSGGSDSAIRATTMFSCFEMSRLLLRRQHPLNSLFLAIFILVLINPTIIFSVGFQLSVVAVASIIIGVPKMQELWKPKLWFIQYLWNIISVTLCAQIGLLPLSIYYFHQIPSLFLIANIPIMAVIPLLMGMAIIIVCLSAITTLPNFIIQSYNFVFSTLIQFVNWIASQEIFIIKNVYISIFGLVTSYLFLGYLRWCYSYKKLALKYFFLSIGIFTSFAFIEKYNNNYKYEVWLLNSKNTTIIEIAGKKVNAFSKNKLTEKEKLFRIKPMINLLDTQEENYQNLLHVYTFKEKNILFINQNFIPDIKLNIDIILISDSPKINLSRLLEKFQPKKIIITANNKFYLKEKWKSTCKQMAYTYYDVSESGSLRLDQF